MPTLLFLLVVLLLVWAGGGGGAGGEPRCTPLCKEDAQQSQEKPTVNPTTHVVTLLHLRSQLHHERRTVKEVGLLQ